MSVLISASPTETERLGATLAAHLRCGDVVGVVGELGAGKTTFIRGACEALGISGRVTSPTFTIGHRYAGEPDVAHLDLYRFESMSVAEWADIEPLLERTIAFVEWPAVGADFLPEPRATITLSHVDEEHRSIDLSSGDAQLVGAFDEAPANATAPGQT